MKRNYIVTAVLALLMLAPGIIIRPGFHASADSKGMANVLAYGAVRGDKKDDTAAFQKALNSGKTVYIPKGTYRIDGFVTLQSNKTIRITGEKGAVIDATRSRAAYTMKIGGYQMEKEQLGTNVTKGATRLRSNLKVKPGDIMLLTSDDLWTPARDYYDKGELVEVKQVSGKDIILDKPLYDSYRAAATKLVKLATPKVSVQGLVIQRNANKIGLWVNYAKNLYVAQSTITGARARCFYVSYIYNGIIEKNKASDFWFKNSPTSYGLSVASSQNIIEKGNTFRGGRHAISHGGREPVRNITVTENMLDSYHPAEQASLDFHENSEIVRVTKNQIYNGITFNGRNAVIENNEVSARTFPGIKFLASVDNANQIRIANNRIDVSKAANGAVHGIYITTGLPHIGVSKVTIINNRIQSAYRGIYISPYHSDTTITQLDISGNVINANDKKAIELETMEGADRFRIDSFVLDNNYVNANRDYALSSGFRQQGKNLNVRSISIKNGVYSSDKEHALYLEEDQALKSQLIMKDVEIRTKRKSKSAIRMVKGFDNVQIDHAKLVGPNEMGYENAFDDIDTLEISNCTIHNFLHPLVFSQINHYQEQGNTISGQGK